MTKEKINETITTYLETLGVEANAMIDARSVYFAFIQKYKKDIVPMDIEVNNFVVKIKEFIDSKGFNMTTSMRNDKLYIKVLERPVVIQSRMDLSSLSLTDLYALSREPSLDDTQVEKISKLVETKLTLINWDK